MSQQNGSIRKYDPVPPPIDKGCAPRGTHQQGTVISLPDDHLLAIDRNFLIIRIRHTIWYCDLGQGVQRIPSVDCMDHRDLDGTIRTYIAKLCSMLLLERIHKASGVPCVFRGGHRDGSIGSLVSRFDSVGRGWPRFGDDIDLRFRLQLLLCSLQPIVC